MRNSVINTIITSLHGSQTSPVVLCMQSNVIRIRNTSFYWSPTLICGLCIQNSDFRTRIRSFSGFLTSRLVFLHSKTSTLVNRIASFHGSQPSPVALCMQNIVLRSRMMIVYWCQPSSVILCIQKSDFSIKISSLYGSCPHLWLLHAKQRL